MELPLDDLLPSDSKARSSQEVGSETWRIPSGSDAHHGSIDAGLFSCSLPVLPHKKLNYVDSEVAVKCIDDASSAFNKRNLDLECDFVEDAIGSLLPDENELLEFKIDDFDLSGLPSKLEDLEDNDIFRSGGDMDFDFQENLAMDIGNLTVKDDYVGANGIGQGQYALQNGVGPVAGEHPYGEHPSRTLFVRNINSNVEDSELRTLFENYGDIRTLYTACKHRGFVMISYYDIRSARTAMRALQNKPLRRRKLDIHFSIPKDNPSDKDINQGTLVAFNIDSAVSNDELRQIFGAYGEVKEIRETPHKRHHKFIEFYDVRAAEAALRSLNRTEIAGKRIKLEPSRPGGARRNLMHQLNQELESDDTRSYCTQVGSPIGCSPPGTWAHFNSPNETFPLKSLNQSRSLDARVPGLGVNNMPGLASVLPSISVKMPPIGKNQGRRNHLEQVLPYSKSTNGAAFESSLSVPDHNSGMMCDLSRSPGTSSTFGLSTSSASGYETFSGHEFLWGSPSQRFEKTQSSACSIPSTNHSFTSKGQRQGFPYSSYDCSFNFTSNSLQHHVGSAPSGVPFDRHFESYPGSPDLSFMNPVELGSMSLSNSGANQIINLGGCAAMSNGAAFSGSSMGNSSPSFGMMSSPGLSPSFFDVGISYSGLGANDLDGLVERGRNRRAENNVNHIDNKKQYQLELEKIVNGEDMRTTLMIKNIPNKYTSKMLLAAIDENHKGTYDFLYLPIDFKNKFNVGYAFINMISPSHIIPFYQAFNGKKWEKFNSEKVASLAYARIQGKAALINHFQNSSLMNEDKRCRPILFHSESGDQEPFPSSHMSGRVCQQDGPCLDSLLDSFIVLSLGDNQERPNNGTSSGQQVV